MQNFGRIAGRAISIRQRRDNRSAGPVNKSIDSEKRNCLITSRYKNICTICLGFIGIRGGGGGTRA